MQYLTYLLPLAALAVANPLEKPRCSNNACLAAVTGPAALGDGKLRASHCASYLATTVTPPAVTVTTTVTGESSKGAWKRASVTVCPNDVPNYASACDNSGYSSACSCFGFTEVKTTTIAPTTTYKTVYVAATCKAGSTVTVTAAKATETVTVTETKTGSFPTGVPDIPGKCLSDAEAETIVNNFRTLLEYTSYNGSRGGAPGRGYKSDVSAATLDPEFKDISDSINYMASFPLGGTTFASKAAFDFGQGVLQPEVLTETLNIWHSCRDITWRWKITPKTLSPYPVVGISHLKINDKGLIGKLYAEFDNGAWLQSFPSAKCSVSPISIKDGPNDLRRRHY